MREGDGPEQLDGKSLCSVSEAYINELDKRNGGWVDEAREDEEDESNRKLVHGLYKQNGHAK